VSEEQFRVDEVMPSYWRVTFANGPVNLVDPDTIDQLATLIDRIEASAELTVVVFRSDNPDYFMAHWDVLADTARIAALEPGPTGLHPYIDNFVRLSRVPVATIAAVRGRARGAGSEFILATDIRFASDTAILSQFEVGAGSIPGGGPMARLSRLIGRGRALEILLGADDIPAALAASYGYVNRVIPDADLDQFVDQFARRVAVFDKVAIAGTKHLVDVASLPDDIEFKPGLDAFLATSARPETAGFLGVLFEHGLQQPDGVERDLGTAVGRLRQEHRGAS
jgi:enoyl-CoA hydratase/carnithine racemase